MLAKTVSHPLENIPASFPTGERWYVFYTHIHAEKRAGESISEIGLPVFIPFEKRILRRPRAKPRHYETALFPRYGFVRFDINDYRWGEIRSADGVADLLRVNSIPRSVPDHVIDGLKLADTVGVFDRTKPPSAGMSVEVTDGPFSNLIGKIKRARSADRMEVVLQFLGGEVPTVIPMGWLKEI